MAMIKLENVNKSFGDLHVLKDVNLEVEEGEKLVIIGPSGSGKSTTVRCMNFLEAPIQRIKPKWFAKVLRWYSSSLISIHI